MSGYWVWGAGTWGVSFLNSCVINGVGGVLTDPTWGGDGGRGMHVNTEIPADASDILHLVLTYEKMVLFFPPEISSKCKKITFPRWNW